MYVCVCVCECVCVCVCVRALVLTYGTHLTLYSICTHYVSVSDRSKGEIYSRYF